MKTINTSDIIFIFPQPFRPEFSDLDYADVDDRSYGPINYKAASIYEAQKRQQHESETEPEDYLL